MAEVAVPTHRVAFHAPLLSHNPVAPRALTAAASELIFRQVSVLTLPPKVRTSLRFSFLARECQRREVRNQMFQWGKT